MLTFLLLPLHWSCSTKLHQTLLYLASKPLPLPLPGSRHLAMASLAILLLLARFSSSIAVSSNSYISRSAEQQVIAFVAPAIVPDVDGQSAQPFLTSPSGSYAAYLRRAVDAATGLGGDACYVQVQQAGGAGSGSLWESDCTPVGGADECDLAFSPVGLELFAGGHSLWDTGVDADPGTLSLDDSGDMKIVSKEGVMVWTASGEPWTGQECGSPLPVSSARSLDSVLPPPSAAGAKLVTPPSATLAGAGSTDFSSGDQLAPPPVDTLPDLPAQPPVDAAPEQPLSLPPADASPDLPDLPLPPPPAYTSPDTPDQPQLPPPPAADISPDLPLYSSPPPAPATSGPDPDTPVPPFGVPFAAPPTGDSSLPGTATPPGFPGSPGGVPFSGSSPAGMPHPHGPAHPHQLPLGASPPLPDALAPGAHGVHGAGPGKPGVPLGHRQQPEGQGVFGQQPQLLNGEGRPLEESSDGWSGSQCGRVAACMALFAVVTLGFGV